jgi:hypothetical protein
VKAEVDKAMSQAYPLDLAAAETREEMLTDPEGLKAIDPPQDQEPASEPEAPR